VKPTFLEQIEQIINKAETTGVQAPETAGIQAPTSNDISWFVVFCTEQLNTNIMIEM